MTQPLKWLALIALREAALPTFDELTAWYREHVSDAPPLALASSTDKLLTLTIGAYTAAVALIPRPAPWSAAIAQVQLSSR